MLLSFKNGEFSLSEKLPITAEMRDSIKKAEARKAIADTHSNLLLISTFSQDQNTAITDYVKAQLKGELKGMNLPEKRSLKLLLKANKNNRAAIAGSAFTNHYNEGFTTTYE
ncbi:hypothetical protein [uncultured Thiothrix sp.]|uniref:hypothetical protein n=1 Tax=uncultured Thiothrix sp. TaxID=223185 RepID=UPI00262629C1|nr:hypothetical protein [uncultured Thiothrix sp.]